MVPGVGEDRASSVDLQLTGRVVEGRQIEDAGNAGLAYPSGKDTELAVVVGGTVDDVHFGAADALREDNEAVEAVVRGRAVGDDAEHVALEADALLIHVGGRAGDRDVNDAGLARRRAERADRRALVAGEERVAHDEIA